MEATITKCNNWQTYQLKNISSITFSGSIGKGARTFDFIVANTGFIYSKGDIITVKDKNIDYAGQIFEVESNNKQPTISIQTMDFMVHLENSEDTMVVNSTAEDTTILICNKLNIEKGEIVKTGIAAGALVYQNKTYYDIINDLYNRVENNKYQIYMQGNKLNVRKKGKIVDYILNDSINCERIDKNENLNNIVNKVVVYDKSNNLLKEKTLDNISKYGIFQKVANEDDDIEAILTKEENTLTVSGLGDYECISGNYIRFTDSSTNIIGLYEIIEDTHSISNNNHKMTLKLEFIKIYDK